MANASTCYFPDGSVSAHDFPCHSPSIGNGASACCGDSDICLSNGLCLNQGGAELISRGSCTDESWQSPGCAQYCLDVVRDNGASILPFGVLNNQFLFCCSQYNISDNTCLLPTKGSSAPFLVEAGRVIFNRTSGSTSPNNTNIATVTVTAANTVSASAAALASSSKTSSVPSSREVAIGVGIGIPLGLAFLIALALLLKQRGRSQVLTKDVQAWKGKYQDTVNAKSRSINGDEYHAPYQLHGWTPNELDSQGASTGRPDEIDGTQILQMEDRTSRAGDVGR